ncbi:phage tail protein [Pseudomonas aeruginosa]|nr:phage tail protein [Pseudomonas aeruginosa]
MLAVLGEIEFEVTSGLSGMELSASTDWAEHPLIKGKPLLEWVGDGLDEYTLTIELHPMLGDPSARQRQLRDAQAAHQPLALVLGSGDYLGAFVITALGNVPRRTWANGQNSISTLTITLREYTGPVEQPKTLLGLIDPSLTADTARPELLSRFDSIKSTAEVALGHARKAAAVIQSGKQLYDVVRRGDVADMLTQAPRLLGVAGKAIAPLEGFSDAAALLQNAGDLAALGSDVLSDVRGIQTSLDLDSLDLENVVDRIGAAGSALERSISLFDDAGPKLASLAAKVATRRA